MLELGIKVQGVYGLKGKIFCAWCNKPIDLCICGGCVVTGSNKQSVANVTWHIGGKNNSNSNSDSGGDDDNDITVTGDSNSDSEYILKETDILAVDIKKLLSLKGFKQGTNNTCVCAGEEFIANALDNHSITESSVLTALAKTFGLRVMFGSFKTSDSDLDTNKLCNTLTKHANSNGLQATSNITDFSTAINEGYLIMTDYLVSSGIDVKTGIPYKDYHDVVVVGYNNEGYIIYDTDRTAGCYKLYPRNKIGNLYSIGIKK